MGEENLLFSEHVTRPSRDPLEIGPDDDFIYYLRQGSELLRRGRPDEARVALERAYELHPGNPKAQNLLGLAYFKLGLLEASKAIYERLVREYPEEAPLHVNLGLVLLRQGRLYEAERALRTALDLAPDHTRAHCYLGLVLYRRHDLVRAREHFLLGDAPEFAKKIERRLKRVAGQSDAVLEEVAAEGLIALDGARPLSTEFNSDARDHDADGWQAHVAHHQSEPGPASLDGEFPLASAVALFPEGIASHPPEPGRPAPRPAVPRRAVARSSLPPAYSETRSNGAAGGDTTRLRLERVPLVEPQLSLLSDFAWDPGFATRSDEPHQARLQITDFAHLDLSTLVAGSGSFTRVPADPLPRVEGRAQLWLEMKGTPIVLRDVADVVVSRSALRGFEGNFVATDGPTELDAPFFALMGRGSVLLEGAGAPLVLVVGPETPGTVKIERALAFGAELSVSRAGDCFHFQGSGFVIFCATS